MPVSRVAACLAFGLAIFTAAAPADAAVKVATYSGTIMYGYDNIGLFGSSGSVLDSMAFELRFVYDTTLGNFYESGGYQSISGGAEYGNRSPILLSVFRTGGVDVVVSGDTADAASAYNVAGPGFDVAHDIVGTGSAVGATFSAYHQGYANPLVGTGSLLADVPLTGWKANSGGGQIIYSRSPGVTETYAEFDWSPGTYKVTDYIAAVGQSMDLPWLPADPGPTGAFAFSVPVVADIAAYFDPVVAVGYDYSIAIGDPLITRAVFPTLPGDPDGYDIYALGGASPALFTDVVGGQWIDFTLLPGWSAGIAGFSLRDINPAIGVDPADATAFVTGLTFSASGLVNLTQAPVTVEWPLAPGVPEPGTWALLIAGFGCTGAAMRRRRTGPGAQPRH